VTGWGLEGWQWLFILEALPSILVGLGVLFYLTDFPRPARWLQKDEVGDRASNREKEQGEGRTSSLLQALTDSRTHRVRRRCSILLRSG
jgi:hypothetical protein